MGLEGEARRGVYETEINIYKRTGVSSTRSGQKNKDGSRCIGLYNRRGVIYRM